MAYISCDNCKHFNVPVNEQPCKDCVINYDLCGELSHHEMFKGYGNCLHSEQPTTASPCNDCIRTLETEKYWVNYTCEEEEPQICCTNCKHVSVLSFDEPCATCLRDYDYSQWEEREHDGKKAEDY